MVLKILALLNGKVSTPRVLCNRYDHINTEAKNISPILNPVCVGVLHNCCSCMEKLDLYGSKLQSAEIWHCRVLCLQMAYHCWCNWTCISFPQIPSSLRGKLLQSKVKLGTTDLLDKSFMQVGNIDPVMKQLCVCFTNSCQNKYMFSTRWENLVPI